MTLTAMDPLKCVSISVELRSLLQDLPQIHNWLQELSARAVHLPTWLWRMGRGGIERTYDIRTGDPEPFINLSVTIEEAHYSASPETVEQFFNEEIKRRGLWNHVSVERVRIDWEWKRY
jgi:hypothetical protein